MTEPLITLFLKNKYSRWHDAIIECARNRKLDVYSERHHVIPRSLGGSDEKINLVDLTYKEHFLVHWLLTKMTEGPARRKMLMALYRMCHCGRSKKKTVVIASWQYAVGRRAVRDSKLGSKKPGVHSEEFKVALSARMKGNKFREGTKTIHSSEARAKMKAAFTEERRAELILRNQTLLPELMKGRECPEVAASNKRRTGEKRSPEIRAKMREAALKRHARERESTNV